MKYSFIFILCIIILFGALLRLDRLGERSLWFDEVMEVIGAGFAPDLKEIIIPSLPAIDPQAKRAEPQLSFYFVRQAIRRYGETPWAIRLPSFIAGSLTVAIIAFLGSSFWGRKEGLIAALLLALSPYHITHSQEARPYVFLVFFSLCSVWCFYQLLFGRRLRWLALLGLLLCTSLNVANSFVAFHLICIQGLFLVTYIFFRRDKSWKLILICLAVGGVAAFFSRAFIAHGVHFVIKHLDPQHEVKFLDFNWKFFRELINYYIIPNYSGWWARIAVCLYGILFAGGLISSYRNKWLTLLLLIWLVLPVVLVFTLFKPFEYFNPRYLILLLPVIILIIARGIVVFLDLGGVIFGGRRVWSYVIGIGLLIGLHLHPLMNYHQTEKDDWLGAAAYLRENIGKDDAFIVSPPEDYQTFIYYFDRSQIHRVPEVKIFNKISQQDCPFIWLVSYSESDSHWRQHYKDAYDEYKKFRDKLEVVERVEFIPKPIILKTVYFENKKIVAVDLGQSKRRGAEYDPGYDILYPQSYNQLGKLDLEIDALPVSFAAAYLRVQVYVVFEDNYLRLYLNDKQILDLRGAKEQQRETIFIPVTNLLKKEGKITFSGELFSAEDSSQELYDVRVEEVMLFYDLGEGYD